MSTCQFCKPLWLKLVILLGILITSWMFATHVNEHKIVPTYQEPLSAKQQAMKEAYLAKRQVPEILIAKDGTTIYYQADTKIASTERPAWLSEEGKLQLEKWQEQQISQETIVTKKILGTELRPVPVVSFNWITEGVSMLALLGTLAGIVWSFGIIKGERIFTSVVLLAILVLSGLYFLSINLFVICVKSSGVGLLIGLSIWPLWAFIDHITNKRQAEEVA